MSYWIGTTRNSAIKSISTKPLWVTTRDASIITALTLVATLVIMAIYWKITNSPTDYLNTAAQILITSMFMQYIYEYSGVNNMIAESSLRYAKHSTLSKYTSRREAIAYKALYRLLISKKYEEPHLRAHFKLLNGLMKHPDMTGALVDFAEDKIDSDNLVRKYPGATDYIIFPKSVLSTLESLIDRITTPIIYDIIVNGLENYHRSDKTDDSISGKISELITNLDEEAFESGNERGVKILAELEHI